MKNGLRTSLLARDSSGAVFLYGESFGLVRYDPGAQQSDTITTGRIVSEVYVAADNTVWCGLVSPEDTEEEVVRVLPEGASALQSPETPYEALSAENEVVGAIAQDAGGHIIVVMMNSGIRWHTGQQWKAIEQVTIDGSGFDIVDAKIQCVAVDEEENLQYPYGGVYLGGIGSGLVKLDSMHLDVTIGKEGTVTSLDTVDVGTKHHIDTLRTRLDSAYVLDTAGMPAPDTLDTMQVRPAYSDTDTVYTIIDTATGDTLASVSAAQGMTALSFVRIDGYDVFDTTAVDTSLQGHRLLSGLSVYDVCIDARGDVWCATNSGLYHGTDANLQRYSAATHEELYTDMIRCCAVADDATVWAGTDDGYFVVRNGSVVEVRNVNNSSLPGNTVNDIVIDTQQSRIWMATTFGVISFVR
jgi:hypothetical protein